MVRVDDILAAKDTCCAHSTENTCFWIVAFGLLMGSIERSALKLLKGLLSRFRP